MIDYDDKLVHAFWKKISGEDYVGDIHKSTSIRTPHWKLIHKFLSGVIFVRTSYGRLVSKMELKLMMMIRDGAKVDWLGALIKGLIENQKAASMNKGLGGGSFVTWIAKKLNFTFEGMEVQREKLHLKMMRARHILGKGLSCKVLPPDSKDEEGNIPMDSSDDEGNARPVDTPSSSTHPPPSSTQPQPSSTYSLERKVDLLLASFGTMAKEQLVLTNYVVEHLIWGERTLATTIQHLDLQSKVETPPVNPFEPQEPCPVPRPSKGKEKVGEPSLLSPHMVDSSIQQALVAIAPSITPSEEDEDVVARFMVAPHEEEDEEEDEEEEDVDIMVGVEDFENKEDEEGTNDDAYASARSTPTRSTSTRSTSF